MPTTGRPPVRSLVQRFDQPSASPSPSAAPRVRTERPSPSTRPASNQMASTASPSRSAREASYGSYKFNNLKPRERPQPAPPSPARTRRPSAGTGAADKTPSPSKVASPSRSQKSAATQKSATTRQPFFGEVVGDQRGGVMPGFGIPGDEALRRESIASGLTASSAATDSPADTHLSPASATRHKRSPSAKLETPTKDRNAAQRSRQPAKVTTPSKATTPSKIPVPRRGTSAASDSGSSTHSTRPTKRTPSRASPTKLPMLPSTTYRGHRPRGKSPAPAASNLQAVVTQPSRSTSPRLRTSRDRQLLPGSPARSADQLDLPRDLSSSSQAEAGAQPSELAPVPAHPPAVESTPVDNNKLFDELEVIVSRGQAPSERLQAPVPTNVSPTLSMPGSFAATPPRLSGVAKAVPDPAPLPTLGEGEMLQAVAFRPPAKRPVEQPCPTPSLLTAAPSELGLRESIPIMLGSDEPSAAGWTGPTGLGLQSPRAMSVSTWRAEPFEDESPVDPFSHRGSLRPDDSASVTFYNSRAPPERDQRTLDSNAYSIINRVLELYHQADKVSPDMAHGFRETVKAVSPVIAQHKDWGSKEATETYLARVLSEANVAHERDNDRADPMPDAHVTPHMDLDELENTPDTEAPGTAIIYLTETRPYSRGSAGTFESSGTLRDGTRAEQPGTAGRLSREVIAPHTTTYPRPPSHSPPPPPPPPPFSPPTPSVYVAEPPSSILPSAPLPNGDESSESGGMQTPASTASSNNASEEVRKRLKQRFMVLKEFLETENAYNKDLVVVKQIFLETAPLIFTKQERDVLFGNLVDLIAFSEKLRNALKASLKPILSSELAAKPDKAAPNAPPADTVDHMKYITPEKDYLTSFGSAFQRLAPELEGVYSAYLLNHDAANDLLKKSLKDPRVLGWQAECIKNVNGLTAAWDLDSLLIKPTQRITRYPLLLDQLLKATPDDHPDLPWIHVASKMVLNINARINNAKRWAEPAESADKSKKQKFLEVRFGKQFAKLWTQKNVKSKPHPGALGAADDPEYDQLSQRFGGHFFQIQIVMRDIDKYIDEVAMFVDETNRLVLGFIGMLESGPTTHPELESQWRKNAMSLVELQSVALPDHVRASSAARCPCR